MTYGRLDAINLIDLEMRLKRMNLDLVTGTPVQHRTLFGTRGVPRPELINFCFHLEQLTRAGVPILEGLTDLRDEILSQLAKVKNEQLLKEIELKYFSRKGELSQIMKSIKDLSDDARRDAGKIANDIKTELTEKFEALKKTLGGNAAPAVTDITLPGQRRPQWHLHPITIIQEELEELFSSLGFMVFDGPELESDYYNFTSLNFPPNHPAREMQDTFFIDKPNKNGDLDLIMRTHTSPDQVRALQKYGAPLRAIIPGKVFRSEATDARHEHSFYHFEGLMVDKNINFSHLKGMLELIGKKLYGENTKLRMRPKFYPFVEPGSNGEFTCFLCGGQGCRVCKYSGWLEILGCGMVDPNVLDNCGIDSKKYTGFAFGMGIERITMLKYGVNDLRLYFENDIRFLKQF